MDAWFLADTNVGHPVKAVRNPVQDEAVCRYGHKSRANACGVIVGVITAYYVDGQSVGGVSSARTWSDKGDSGGPVFGGTGRNTAIGITSGSLFYNDLPVKDADRMMWFTKIKNAEANTSTRVCLDPVCG